MIELIPVDDVEGSTRSPRSGSATGASGSGGAAATVPVTERQSREALDLNLDGVEDLVRAVLDADTSHGDGSGTDRRWGTYFGVDPDTRRVVGTCGYRGVPRAGRVEVAFWTFPPFEGCGWATAMARALVDRALADPQIEVVLAHTLPERAPATSVLTAAGLRLADAVRRDERSGPGAAAVRGRVWRWERRRRG